MRINIFGICPSNSAPDNTPFHTNIKSRQTLDKWLDLYKPVYYNVIDHKLDKTPRIKDVCIKDVRNKIQKIDGPIIACGNFVSKILDKMEIEHFKLPHPSGLNYFWNCPKRTDKKLKEMYKWIKYMKQ